MGEGALLAKHCFASARTHSRQRLGRAPEGDLQRPPQPDPPRHPTECMLLLMLLRLTLIRQVQGAALQRNPYSYGSRVMWMSVGVDSGMFRSARMCSRLKYRSLRVAYTCRGLATYAKLLMVIWPPAMLSM